ncbi:MAG: alpha/beta fold hydrolase [Actinomycetota bacterium]|nr:alpha/beta fold hydrolase [Actinomycetota bacterium]
MSRVPVLFGTALTAAACALVGLAGFGPPAATAAPAATALDWAACTKEGLREGGFECATLVVPMDREQPGAGSFRLAVARHRSNGPADQRIGSLIFNPGGPGGSGLDALSLIWHLLPAGIKSRFDLVTWDPRGIGATRPVLRDCATPFPARPATGPIDWASVVRGFATTMAAANRACQQRNSSFIEHMGTNEVVQDLDRLRSAIGDEKLTYWGMSAGTRIGYVYALAFPDRVRAVLLDGSIDPASTLLSLTEGGAAPDQAFGSFADTYPTAAAQWADVLTTLDERTFALPDEQVLDRWVLADFVYNYIAQQAFYPDVAYVIELAHAALLGPADGRAEAATALAMVVAGQRSAPNSNAGGAFAVVNCLDYPGRPSVSRMVSAVKQQVRLGPEYGGSLGTMFATNCSGFTFDPDPIPLITGPGSDVPVLILGASRDGSTIVQWTARMSRAFPESRTVTYAGGQHITWLFAGSTCVDRVANAYLTSQRLPVADRGCPNTVRPAS